MPNPNSRQKWPKFPKNLKISLDIRAHVCFVLVSADFIGHHFGEEPTNQIAEIGRLGRLSVKKLPGGSGQATC